MPVFICKNKNARNLFQKQIGNTKMNVSLRILKAISNGVVSLSLSKQVNKEQRHFQTN